MPLTVGDTFARATAHDAGVGGFGMATRNRLVQGGGRTAPTDDHRFGPRPNDLLGARADPAELIARTCKGVDRAADRPSRETLRRGWVRALCRRADAKELPLSFAVEQTTPYAGGLGLFAETDLLRAFMHVSNDEAARGLALATTAGRLVEDEPSALVASILSRTAYWLLGDLASFEKVRRHAVALPDCGGTRLAALIDNSVEAAVEFQQLRFPMAGLLARRVIEMAPRCRLSRGVSILPIVIMAQISYELGHLAEADTAIRSLLPRVRADGMPETAIRAYTVLARSAARRGLAEFATTVLKEGENLAATRGWPRLSAACLAERIDLLATCGLRAEAGEVFDRLSRLYRDGERLHDSGPASALYLELARFRLLAMDGAAAGEVRTIRSIIAETLSRGDLLLAVKLMIRLVGAMVREGDDVAALEVMTQALKVSCDAGLFQSILDGGPEVEGVLRRIEADLPDRRLAAFVATLLERWPLPSAERETKPSPKRSTALITSREKAVLQLMSLGQSNKRIAQRLGIAPETVKSHAKNIYARLGSSTRAEAVSRGTSLGLI